jgi:hypothetical protein
MKNKNKIGKVKIITKKEKNISNTLLKTVFLLFIEISIIMTFLK